MASAPNNYPGGWSNEEIESRINELSNRIVATRNLNEVLGLSPIISLGQSELQKRILESNRSITRELHAEVKRLSEVAEKNATSSEKYSKASKWISLTALFISVLSIGISIYLSVQSSQETERWRQDELNLLQKILEKKQVSSPMMGSATYWEAFFMDFSVAGTAGTWRSCFPCSASHRSGFIAGERR